VSHPAPDRAVRGRTRAGRLEGLDVWLCHEAGALLLTGGLVVDVGFGASAVTVEALAEAVHQVNPGLEVVGVERDASRVSPEARGARLVLGGFEALAQLQGAVVVRAMNVLRGYRAEEVPLIHRALGAGLVEGGLLLEGSTDTEGHVSVSHLLRRRGGGLVSEGLLFHTDFERGFSPWLFRDWLPRDLRRAVRPGTRVHGLLEQWSQGVEAAGPGRSPRERFSGSVGQVEGLSSTPWEQAHGYARALDVLEG
jgi:hypothetical protein